MTIDDYVAQLKSLLLRKGVEHVFKRLVDKFVFFAGGPQAYIAKKIISWVLEKAIYEGEMAAFFKYTDIRVDRQGRKLYEAMEWNYNAQLGNSEEEKEGAEIILIDRFREFIKLAA